MWTILSAIFLLLGTRVQGFRPASDWRTSRLFPLHALVGSSPSEAKTHHAQELDWIQKLSESAIHARGTRTGLENLAKLSQKCAERQAFNFECDDSSDTRDEHTVISRLPGLLPISVTQKILEKVEGMLERGWLSTNPDSVDGQPSFHLNLVGNGKPIVSGDDLDDFQSEIQSMLQVVGPFVYEKLLPHVNAQLGSDDSIQVSDIFIRRYGQDMVEGKSRNGISAHYDVFSRVTSVVALDNVAHDGRNGLYTTVNDFSVETGSRTSNHAALRRFFPLGIGDAVVHTWNVLHGVDVEEGIDRASLIVWFTEKTSVNEGASPWLEDHPNLERDNVAQFVLASATESSEPTSRSQSQGSLSMHHGVDGEQNTHGRLHKAVDLYLSSASRGNSFAMTRLGSLLEEDKLNPPAFEKAKSVLKELRQKRAHHDQPDWIDCQQDERVSLARGFWYEASLCGNALAQIALADDIMASNAPEPDARLLSATLFGLAAQQNNDQAIESLERLVTLDLQFSGVSTQDEFEASPVVQTAQVATAHL